MHFDAMSYEEIISHFRQKLPSFPDGRIDYHKSKERFVFNIRIKYQDQILLLKRSNKVGAYKNKRDCIGGFIDEEKPITQKVNEEIHEELGITPEYISSIHQGKIHIMKDQDTGISRINFPIIAEIKSKPKIKLDRENTEYQRIKPPNITKFDTIPELEKSYQYATI